MGIVYSMLSFILVILFITYFSFKSRKKHKYADSVCFCKDGSITVTMYESEKAFKSGEKMQFRISAFGNLRLTKVSYYWNKDKENQTEVDILFSKLNKSYYSKFNVLVPEVQDSGSNFKIVTEMEFSDGKTQKYTHSFLINISKK